MPNIPFDRTRATKRLRVLKLVSWGWRGAVNADVRHRKIYMDVYRHTLTVPTKTAAVSA